MPAEVSAPTTVSVGLIGILTNDLTGTQTTNWSAENLDLSTNGSSNANLTGTIYVPLLRTVSCLGLLKEADWL